MKIATIILNYNSSADCRRCIGYLQRQQGVEQEIIVVDNCSRKEEIAAVQDICHKTGVTFIANSINSGYNAGNNVGLRYAAQKGYELALIANPDMEFPQQDYLAKMVAAINTDKDIVVCGSDIAGLDGRHQSPMHRDGDWHGCWGWLTTFFKKRNAESDDFIDDFAHSHYCSKVSGCCLLIHLPFIESIGFFDEYPLLYCEEAILSRQVESAGKKMYYTTEAQAVHAHRKSEKGNPIKRFKEWRRSRLYFIDKYSGDTTLGKVMAGLSICTYTSLLIFINGFKRCLK